MLLEDDLVEGKDPWVGFDPDAASHLRRTDIFPHAPDLLANSVCNSEANEVVDFEGLIRSHAGLGG